PHKPRHTFAQKRLTELLDARVEGEGVAYAELAVETSEGIKVPDVVWISHERLDRIPEDATASPVMPEICVEVLSRGNSEREMTEKRALYFAHGAREVWLYDLDGTLRFFDADGPLDRSTFAPTMPTQA
ncbi:MAG: Uma2 family endonuclease, partial [Bacteroidota bacterium]